MTLLRAATIGAVLTLAAPARSVAVCQGFEYEVAVQRLLTWPEQGLYVAHLKGSYGQAGAMSRWFFLGPGLRRLAEMSILPVAPEPSVELDAGARATLGARRAEAVQAVLRSAAQASPPLPERTEGFDDALTAALVALGARVLPYSTACLGDLAPCSAFVSGRSWSCEVRRADGDWLSSRGVGRQSLGCFEDVGRAIVRSEASASTGPDCDTTEQWVHWLPAIDRSACPECRTGFTPDRQPTRVPVLGIAAGPAPAFEPLGFGPDGRLFFRFRAAGAPGEGGVGSYDPANDALTTRGVTLPRSLHRLRARDGVAPGGSFVRAGVRYTLAPGGPLDARSTELELAPPGQGPRRSWTATLVSARGGAQPLAALLQVHEIVEWARPPTWHLVAPSPTGPHLVAVASVETGGTTDLAFFSADLGEAAAAAVRDPPPSWGERELGMPGPWWRGRLVGFSPAGLFAFVPDGDDPDARVWIVRLADDAVVARAPVASSAASLRRNGIVPGLFTAEWAGTHVVAVGDRAYRVERAGADVILAMFEATGAAIGRKNVGTLEPEEADPPREPGAWLVVSPFEPRAAIVVPTGSGTRVFGAHLRKGFVPATQR